MTKSEKRIVRRLIRHCGDEATIDAACAMLDRKPRRIGVHVQGGVAYCDDPRVIIIDHDNETR